jgi:subtilase family serine protease
VLLTIMLLGGTVSAGVAKAAPLGATPVCGPVPAGFARCFAELAAGGAQRKALSPLRLKRAYDFPTSLTLGQGQTIAIVSAFDAPTIESDLATFDSRFGLPACTTGNGCFTKLDQNGGTVYPATDAGWSLESHLDVEWAHAIAPGAKIVLVEANTNLVANLFTALDTATVHAGYISNSWGSPEASAEAVFEHHFTDTPGKSYFFGSGDTGAPGIWPAASPSVVAVGGTTLHFNARGQFTQETGWSSGGGGCSLYLTASSAQAALPDYANVGCAGKRAFPDLALDADPQSGVAIYDSQPSGGLSGWSMIGGTSLSTPLVAARAASTGQLVNQAQVYGNSIAFRDILVGNNGFACANGYDLVTGRGTWTG